MNAKQNINNILHLEFYSNRFTGVKRLGGVQLLVGLADVYESECVGAFGTTVKTNKCLLESGMCRK